MDEATLARLLEPAGQRLLARAEELLDEGVGPLRAGELVRRAAGADGSALAAAALSQADLRRRARTKLGPDATRLLLTPDGLEQATRSEVARHRTARVAQACPAGAPVLDLCCGVGGDLAALARAGLAVTGVDLDPVTAAVARANLAALGLRGEVLTADATAVDRTPFAAVVLDPARRGARGRTFDLDAYRPPWSFVEEVLAGPSPAVVKVAPGVPHDRVPAGVEAEWVSVGGEVKEAALWAGWAGWAGGARDGVRRRATLLRPDHADGGPDDRRGVRPEGSAPTLTDADDPGPEAVGTGPVARWLVEPDGAVVRAGLVTAVAAAARGHLLDEHIAYVATDTDPRVPAAPGALPAAAYGRAYEVREELPYAEKRLRAALRERGVGRLTVKKRGVAVVPEELRRRLALRGDEEATLVLTRVAGRGTALLVDPVPPGPP